eukprot:g5093.t1
MILVQALIGESTWLKILTVTVSAINILLDRLLSILLWQVDRWYELIVLSLLKFLILLVCALLRQHNRICNGFRSQWLLLLLGRLNVLMQLNVGLLVINLWPRMVNILQELRLRRKLYVLLRVLFLSIKYLLQH